MYSCLSKEFSAILLVTENAPKVKEFLDYMNENYPKALNKLKELCEK